MSSSKTLSSVENNAMEVVLTDLINLINKKRLFCFYWILVSKRRLIILGKKTISDSQRFTFEWKA